MMVPEVLPENYCTIENCTLKCKPWEQYGIFIRENISGVTIQNCTVIRISWREWLIEKTKSIFGRRKAGGKK
jgi:hypothetical protein